MAFTGITATEAMIDQKTGANVSTSFTDTMKTVALLEAESSLNIITKQNWSDWYALNPDVDFKSKISDITSSMVAIEAIRYDMSGYTSRGEATDMITVLRDKINRGLQVLRDIDTRNWILTNDGV